MTETEEIKKELRQSQKAAFRALDGQWRQQADAAICRRLAALSAFQKAKTVFCFVPMADEVDVTAFLQTVLEQGKTLAVPLCMEKGQMLAKKITALSLLQKGAYGIPEPSADAVTVSPQEIGFAVIPGLGFDRNGGRLGRGGGYYDRYLGKIRGGTAGVTYEALLLSQASFSPWDRRVQGVCTEEKLYK